MASNPLLSPNPEKSLLTGKAAEAAPTAPTTSGVNDTLRTGAQLLQTAGAPKPPTSSRQPAQDRAAPSRPTYNLAGHDAENRQSGVNEGYPEAPYNQPGQGGGEVAPGGYGGPGETSGPNYPTGGGGTGGTGAGSTDYNRAMMLFRSLPMNQQEQLKQQNAANFDEWVVAWYKNARAAGVGDWTGRDWNQAPAGNDPYSTRDWSGSARKADMDAQYQRLVNMGIPPAHARRIVSIALGGMEHDWRQYGSQGKDDPYVPISQGGWGNAQEIVDRFLQGDQYYDPSCPVDAPYKSQHGGTGCVEKPWDVAFDSPGGGEGGGGGGGGGGGTGGGGGGGGQGGGGGKVEEKPEYKPPPNYTTAGQIAAAPAPAPQADRAYSVNAPSQGAGPVQAQPGAAYVKQPPPSPVRVAQEAQAKVANPGATTVGGGTPLMNTGW